MENLTKNFDRNKKYKFVVIRDYIYPGNYSHGEYDLIEEKFVMDDGSIFSVDEILSGNVSGSACIFLTPDDIVEYAMEVIYER